MGKYIPVLLAVLLLSCTVVNEIAPAKPGAASLEFSSFIGGNGSTVVCDICTDRDGYLYIVGETSSSDFPTTEGALGKTWNGGTLDAFVVKMAPDGRRVFSTYLGGSGEDSASGIAVDAQGNMYVTGKTYSTNFPVTPGVLSQILNGERDAFVSKLSPDGKTLIYSTFLGGPNWDYGHCITVDRAGNAFVGGFTHGVFPVTDHVVGMTFGGMGDGFVVKLDATASRMIFSTYIGGNSWESVDGIVLGPDGNIFITGGTHSTNFPTTDGAYNRNGSELQTNYSTDGFVAKLDPSASRFLYSTYLGGKKGPCSEGFTDIVVDSEGNAYMTGSTNQPDYPVTANACQPSYGGGESDAIMAKLSPDGSALLYSTFFGGSGCDRARRIVLDSSHNVSISGFTSSVNMPMSGFPLQNVLRGGSDAFLARIDHRGSLWYSTYLGGSGSEDPITALAMDRNGRLFIAGRTCSPDFPIAGKAFQPVHGGGNSNGFISGLSFKAITPGKEKRKAHVILTEREVTGASDRGFSEAAANAVDTVTKSGENVRSFQVVEQRGVVHNNTSIEFQVILRITVEKQK